MKLIIQTKFEKHTLFITPGNYVALHNHNEDVRDSFIGVEYIKQNEIKLVINPFAPYEHKNTPQSKVYAVHPSFLDRLLGRTHHSNTPLVEKQYPLGSSHEPVGEYSKSLGSIPSYKSRSKPRPTGKKAKSYSKNGSKGKITSTYSVNDEYSADGRKK